MCFPEKMFKKTEEESYVMLVSGDGDMSICVFDSTSHFIKSENSIMEVR